MKGLQIVGLGAVSEETRGTMIEGVSDPGGVHYFIHSESGSTHPGRKFDEEPEANTGAERVPDSPGLHR